MHEDRYLVRTGIATNSNRTSRELAHIQAENFTIPGKVGSYIRSVFREVVSRAPNSSGTAFEYICASVFLNQGLAPFALKARLKNVPAIEIDILFWDARISQPVVVQLTSSLRERYSLADIQAFRIKHSYPGAKVWLLCMSQEEVAHYSDYRFESLDGLLFPDSIEFESLLDALKDLPKSILGAAALENNIDRGKVIVEIS
jgi:hypothetical protein